jgi:hypothetical protein
MYRTGGEQLALAHFLPHAKHRNSAAAPAIISSGGGKQFGYAAAPPLDAADTTKQHNKCV